MMVEWSSLLFFATLFVLMESLTKIGLIKYIGEQLSELVKLAPVTQRLTVAIFLVLWVNFIVYLNYLQHNKTYISLGVHIYFCIP